MFKRIAKILIATFAVLLTAVGCQVVRNSGDMSLSANTADTLRLATYNVHYINMRQQTGAWSLGDWDRRKTPLDSAFKAISADIIGFQEMESFAGGSGNTTNLVLEWLLPNNPPYAAAAVGDPRRFPSTQPILYRKDRVQMLDQGWFFFSDTPDVIYSRTFNGSYPAYATWAQFRDLKTNRAFRILNMHTDFSSLTNRLRSAELVAARIKPWADAGETVFVMGDMNARLGDKVVDILTDAGVTFAPVRGATYHFNRGLNLFGAIDHIGVIGNARPAQEPIVLRRKFDDEWPTDHYPVIVDYDLSATRP